MKCYTCDSDQSFDECTKKVGNGTACPSGNDRCVKADVTGKQSGKEVQIYFKGCATKADCDKEADVCKKTAAALSLTDAKCDVYCCEGNLCNEGKVPLVSFIALSACALAAFIP